MVASSAHCCVGGTLVAVKNNDGMLQRRNMIWLVVWNHGILWLSIYIGNIFIIPTDELTPSFFRGLGLKKPNISDGGAPCTMVNHHQWSLVTRNFGWFFLRQLRSVFVKVHFLGRTRSKPRSGGVQPTTQKSWLMDIYGKFGVYTPHAACIPLLNDHGRMASVW